MLQPGFLREQTNDTLSALRLSVSDPFAIFLSKLCAKHIIPVDYRAAAASDFRGAVQRARCLAWWPQLALVLFLGSLGLSVTGTTLSAIFRAGTHAGVAASPAAFAVADAAADRQHGGHAALFAENPALRWTGWPPCWRSAAASATAKAAGEAATPHACLRGKWQTASCR